MELTEYVAVLRRHWRIWIGCTVVSVLAALLVLQVTPRTYEATARVFVSASPSISNSAQYVNQRAKSYPAVAASQAVLGPVIERLGLDETVTELRGRVSAENPPDTSQVQVTTSSGDPEEAAAIANAVAEQLADVVEELETPQSGNRPVTLTVNDPATVPVRPVSPVALFVLALGLVAGLFVGLAAAIVRSRLDTSVHSEDDVRRVWGEQDLDVLAPRRGRARRSALTGRAATALARRLELIAGDRSLRVALLCPSPDELRAARALAEDVAVELRGRELPTTVTGPGVAGGSVADERQLIRLEVADPLAPLRFWREVAARYDGVVLVVPVGRVDEAELLEVRRILRDVHLRPLAVVLARGRGVQRAGRKPPSPTVLPGPPAELRTASDPAATARRVPPPAPGSGAGAVTATVPAATTVTLSPGSPDATAPTGNHDVPDTEHKGGAVPRRGR
ncbi:YveK family protein [Blastococcus sp. PRF04-17]|uniref:YveK family protein n=1 Tax=Blastococcus sp. PRF04-17 TaxID=2933797 RepID=UPI001FF2F67E|nr:Wzz/FepE/Etk N-terminal domain-containing protein [Blastococcus sp. PRF04-17]UOX99763.1 Wzz/FepE/Etk N-terminal domain-containing protein [Blastococcus sp. PRF04-17]